MERGECMPYSPCYYLFFFNFLGMDVGITTLTAPFVFSVWITVGIRYMLLTLFPAKRKVA